MALPVRLQTIHSSLVELIGREAPDECGIEDVYFSTNVKTAFATGQARGVALLATVAADMPVAEYGPSEIKLAVTGNGAADKSQVAYMVKTILGLAQEVSPDHAADALAVAICHANNRSRRALLARAQGSGDRA
jgi:crossover junction endodeoxyribonuclease RuvC